MTNSLFSDIINISSFPSNHFVLIILDFLNFKLNGQEEEESPDTSRFFGRIVGNANRNYGDIFSGKVPQRLY